VRARSIKICFKWFFIAFPLKVSAEDERGKKAAEKEMKVKSSAFVMGKIKYLNFSHSSPCFLLMLFPFTLGSLTERETRFIIQ
jgi:hypothetical protein